MESGNLETLQLDGGSLVFDFTNTIGNRKTESAIEYLGRYEDILTWSQRAGILTPHQHTFLNTKAEENQQRAKAEYKRAVRLREILYILFSNIAAGHTPQADITSAFNKELTRAFSNFQLEISNINAIFVHRQESNALSKPLDLVIRSAYDVLTSEDFPRIKECSNCGWLFLDKTKNGKRKWCDMNVCGSKDKAKRYYHKKKERPQ